MVSGQWLVTREWAGRGGSRAWAKRRQAMGPSGSVRAGASAPAMATYVFHYNFVRPHTTLVEAANGRPVTPALADGLAERPWTMAQLIGLLEAREDTAVDLAMRRYDRRLAA